MSLSRGNAPSWAAWRPSGEPGGGAVIGAPSDPPASDSPGFASSTVKIVRHAVAPAVRVSADARGASAARIVAFTSSSGCALRRLELACSETRVNARRPRDGEDLSPAERSLS